MKYIVYGLLILLTSCKSGTRNQAVPIGTLTTTNGHTMAIIRGPVEFKMGSPAGEKYRTEDEVQHAVTIPRSFAIASKEVTVRQFQEFLEENPHVKLEANVDPAKNPSITNSKLLFFSPYDSCPQILVTWYEAALYCNWLSKKEGIAKEEWVYPVDPDIHNGAMLDKHYLRKKGYRLPTEAEWEYAARAGTNTSRYYGDADSLLALYAVYSKNPPKRKQDPNDPNDPSRTYPVGQRRPNSFGLYDMYGNVWEWCDSRRLPYLSTHTVDEARESFIIGDSIAMIRRGGSFSYGADVMRSAHRGATNYFPNQRRDNVGFRIAKTVD